MTNLPDVLTWIRIHNEQASYAAGGRDLLSEHTTLSQRNIECHLGLAVCGEAVEELLRLLDRFESISCHEVSPSLELFHNIAAAFKCRMTDGSIFYLHALLRLALIRVGIPLATRLGLVLRAARLICSVGGEYSAFQLMRDWVISARLLSAIRMETAATRGPVKRG